MLVCQVVISRKHVIPTDLQNCIDQRASQYSRRVSGLLVDDDFLRANLGGSFGSVVYVRFDAGSQHVFTENVENSSQRLKSNGGSLSDRWLVFGCRQHI